MNTDDLTAIEAMLKITPSLDIDCRDNPDFPYEHSGLRFLQNIRRSMGLSMTAIENFAPHLRFAPLTFESADSWSETIKHSYSHSSPMLPPRGVAMRLVGVCLDNASTLVDFVHRPTIESMFDRLYTLSATDYQDEEKRYLGLLYSLLAVGCLYDKEVSVGREEVLTEG